MTQSGLLRAPRLLAIASAILLLALGVTACGPLPDYDAMQERVTTPAPRLGAGHQVSQTFIASQPGLTSVEVMLVSYPPDQGADSGWLTMTVRDAASAAVVGSVSLPLAAIEHNSRHRVVFPARRDSAGRRYALTLEATTPGDARVTPWRTEDDAYTPGDLSYDEQPLAGDLAFRAYYDYDAGALMADLSASAPRALAPCLVLVLALVLPGLVLCDRRVLGSPVPNPDFAERLGVWIGVSLATWSLLWLLATSVGLRITGGIALALLVAQALVAAGLAWHGRGSPAGSARLAGSNDAGEDGPPTAAKIQPWGRLGKLLSPAAATGVVAVIAIGLRFVQARGLALPMWVDSVHHTLIIDLLSTRGMVPDDYGPLVPAQAFTYHFGFHTVGVLLVWLGSLTPDQAVLFLGQALGGLVVFPTYLLGSRLAGSRWAGFSAALLVGLVSTFPSYYVSWGRYTHLAGMMLLPAAFVALSSGQMTRRLSVRAIGLGAVLAAGQVLVHPRIALLLGALLAADWLVFVATGSEGRRPRLTDYIGIAGAALGGIVLLAPWLRHLASSRITTVIVQSAESRLDTFPLGLVVRGYDRYIVAAALLGLAAGFAFRRRETPVLTLWALFGLAIANPTTLGLAINPMLGNDALAISVWLPVAVAAGALVPAILDRLATDRVRTGVGMVLAATAVAIGLVGTASLVSTANPGCVLATSADVDALSWVRANVGPDATFLVNARRWQYNIYAGTDGGYWLVPVVGRASTLPPLVYDHGGVDAVERIRQTGADIEASPGRTPQTLRALAQRAGATHVFVGTLGGPITLKQLDDPAAFRLLYTNGRASVYGVVR